MPLALQNKTVLITGASSGIGRATALLFAAQGANIIATARRADRLQSLVAEIKSLGGQASFHAGDAAEESTARACLALAPTAPDILINNAGIGNYKSLVDTSLEDYEALLRTNLRSGFVFSRAVAPAMIARRSGTILFVSSVAGLQGAANESVYSATKFAQVGFAQSLDAELRPHNIKVAALCPGGVKSEFALGHGRTQESIRASRMMDPAEVALTLLHMCTLPPNLRIPQLTLRHMG